MPGEEANALNVVSPKQTGHSSINHDFFYSGIVSRIQDESPRHNGNFACNLLEEED